MDATDTSVLVGAPTATADGAQNRWYYTGMVYGNHGSSPGSYGKTLVSPDRDTAWKNYAAGEVLNYTTVHTYTGGTTYDTATDSTYTFYYADDSSYSVTVKAGDVKLPTEYSTTLLPTNAGYQKNTGLYEVSYQQFHTMVGVAGHIYAIRVYDRALTDAERQQNHAVDLMAYFGLDVRGFSAADGAAKAAVYEAFAGYTFAADEAQVAEMQAAIDAAVSGIPVAEGVQKGTDGASLRIWASMDTAENVSKLGMTVVFKQDGVVKSEKSGETQTAFASITSGGETVTAEALRAELLYAAVVTGIPAGTYTVEVTPYVILMDETVVTGDTKTMDITFGS